MLKRNIEKHLAHWKESPIRKPLIIRGARQVGKTSVVREFGKNNFTHVIEINLEKNDHFHMFDQSRSIQDFLQRAGVLFDTNIEEGHTLLFIDEIQQSSHVMGLLRFFAEEKPGLHVIATGSLMESRMTKVPSVPVGRVEYMYLYPLTFFEYLEAKGKDILSQELHAVTVGNRITDEALVSDLFAEYLRIGGMPEVVANFVLRHDYRQTKEILARLRTAYIDDITKYAKSISERKYLELVITYAPKIAGGLFTYENFGGSAYRSREMSEAMSTIEQVRLLTQVKAVNSAQLPLFFKEKRPKKMLWLDVGMVNETNNYVPDMMMGTYQGKIMEQIVGQLLIADGMKQPMELGYWSRNRDEGSAEVDFCFQYGDHVVGLEVKSGSTQEMKSLFSMKDLGGDQVIPVRVSWNKLGMESYAFHGKKYRILSLPFYLLERWRALMGATSIA